MAEVLTDERVVVVLRPFVRATAPVLEVLRESDPLRLRGRFDAVAEQAENAEQAQNAEQDDPGLLHKLLRQLDGMRLPGSSTWDAMGLEERCDWWAQRVGRLVAVVAGLPRFGGVVTSRLPIRNALGLAGQGLVLSAIAAEHGVTDPATRVRLIANVLLSRDISHEVAEQSGSRAEEDARTAEMTEELDDARRTGGARAKAVVRTVWRMARALWEINSELDKRPQGRLYHELIGNVPVVGVVGGYLGERSALRRVGRGGAKWLRREGHAVAEG